MTENQNGTDAPYGEELAVIDRLLQHQIQYPHFSQSASSAIDRRLHDLDAETREFLTDDGPEYQP